MIEKVFEQDQEFRIWMQQNREFTQADNVWRFFGRGTQGERVLGFGTRSEVREFVRKMMSRILHGSVNFNHSTVCWCWRDDKTGKMKWEVVKK